MIRCPKCGTLNRDGSRFCNECGAPLQRTSIRCPMCGALNPVGNIFCDRCHARLVPLQSVVPPESKAKPEEQTGTRFQGISLPTRTPVAGKEPEKEEPTEGLPDWLQGLLDTDAQGQAPTPKEPAPKPNHDIPDWIEGLTPEEPETTEAAVETPSDAEIAPESLPDWLTPDAESISPEPEKLEVQPKTIEEPEGESPLTPEAEYEGIESFDWLSELTEETSNDISPTPEPEPVEEEFPDWLSEQLGEATSDVPSVPVPEAVGEESPDWLSERLQETPHAEIDHSADTEKERDAVPTWLSNLSTKSAPQTEDLPFEVAEHGAGVPNWLSALATDKSLIEAPTYEFEAATGEPPAWLSAPTRLTTSKPEEKADTPQASPEETLPEWLAEREPVDEITPAAGPEPLSEELPDWIVEAQSKAEETAATTPSEEALPDWLSPEETAEEATTPKPVTPFSETAEEEEELPDWLSGLEIDEPSEGPEAEPVTQDEMETEALPDWLQGLLPEEAATTSTPPFTGIPKTESAPEPQRKEPAPVIEDSEQALPEWLTTIQSEQDTAEAISPFMESLMSSSREVPETEKGEAIFTAKIESAEPKTPAPLREPPAHEEIPVKTQKPDIEAKETEEEEDLLEAPSVKEIATKETDVPDWLKQLGPAGETEALGEQPEGLEQARVPSWLQELRPPGTGPLPQDALPPEGEITTSAGKSDLAPAEIPDWVQNLRPTGETIQKTSVDLGDELAHVAEAQGPLSGLQGMLPALAIADIPADFQPKLKEKIPETVTEQAELWQQLLERPRGEERPVAQVRTRPGISETLLRMTITLALIATILASLLGYLPTPLAQAPDQPGIAPLFKTIEALQPGDKVLMPLEYGPAEAEEMTYITEILLDHLLDREIQVTMLSTIPEGQGLVIKQQASKRYQTNQDLLRMGAYEGYLPGNASGVSQLLGVLNEENEVDLLLVVTARSDRLRWWVEQNALKGNNALPISFGLSGAVGPIVTPYLETRESRGWLTGVPGVAAYRETRGIAPDTSLRLRMDTLMLNQWIVAGLLLGGAAYYLAAGKKGAA